MRRWQTEGRLVQQIADFVSMARSETDAAERGTGNQKLWHLDRAASACTRVLHLKADHDEALQLVARIKQLRDAGISERVHAGRKKLIVAAGFSVLAIAAIVTLVVAGNFAQQRREAQLAMDEANARLATSEYELGR